MIGYCPSAARIQPCHLLSLSRRYREGKGNYFLRIVFGLGREEIVVRCCLRVISLKDS